MAGDAQRHPEHPGQTSRGKVLHLRTKVALGTIRGSPAVVPAGLTLRDQGTMHWTVGNPPADSCFGDIQKCPAAPHTTNINITAGQLPQTYASGIRIIHVGLQGKTN